MVTLRGSRYGGGVTVAAGSMAGEGPAVADFFDPSQAGMSKNTETVKQKLIAMRAMLTLFDNDTIIPAWTTQDAAHLPASNGYFLAS